MAQIGQINARSASIDLGGGKKAAALNITLESSDLQIDKAMAAAVAKPGEAEEEYRNRLSVAEASAKAQRAAIKKFLAHAAAEVPPAEVRKLAALMQSDAAFQSKVMEAIKDPSGKKLADMRAIYRRQLQRELEKENIPRGLRQQLQHVPGAGRRPAFVVQSTRSHPVSSVPERDDGKPGGAPAPATQGDPDLAAAIDGFRTDFDAVRGEVGKMIVGYRDQVEKVLIALVVGGNVLLESVPGLGKTMLVHTLGRVLSLDFRRVQFTADLMPADIIGTNVVDEDEAGQRVLHFQRGPLFTHLLLADEINRATPRTQSALLEAMEEHTVTVGGHTHVLEEPFFVMATQNPIEQAGTYPLPAAQLDKFLFKLLLGYPDGDELDEILGRTTQDTPPVLEAVAGREKILRMRALARNVPAASHVQRYAALLVAATHPESPHATALGRRCIRMGSSPRGVLALLAAARVRALLEGRCQVSTDDVRAMAPEALRHRISRSFEAESDNVDPDQIIDDLLAGVPADAAEVFAGPAASV